MLSGCFQDLLFFLYGREFPAVIVEDLVGKQVSCLNSRTVDFLDHLPQFFRFHAIAFFYQYQFMGGTGEHVVRFAKFFIGFFQDVRAYDCICTVYFFPVGKYLHGGIHI